MPANRTGIAPSAARRVRTLNVDDAAQVSDDLLVDDAATLGLTFGNYPPSRGNRNATSVWDLTTGVLLCRPNHGFGAHITLAPDGRHLLARARRSDRPDVLMLYDVRSGTRLRESSSRTYGLGPIAMTPDAHYAAAGSGSVVEVWALD